MMKETRFRAQGVRLCGSSRPKHRSPCDHDLSGVATAVRNTLKAQTGAGFYRGIFVMTESFSVASLPMRTVRTWHSPEIIEILEYTAVNLNASQAARPDKPGRLLFARVGTAPPTVRAAFYRSNGGLPDSPN
jgi:hypothetical protein